MIAKVKVSVAPEQNVYRILDVTVEFESEEDDDRLTVDKLFGAMAYKFFEQQLRDLLDEEGYTVHWETEFLALTMLAAARAGVNPAYIEHWWDYTTDEPPSILKFKDVTYKLSQILRVFINVAVDRLLAYRIFKDEDPDIATVLEFIYTLTQLTGLPAVLEALSDLVEISSKSPEKIERLAVFKVLKQLKRDADAYYVFANKASGYGNIIRLFRQAALEARDPEFKRLAELLADSAEKQLELAKYVRALFHDLAELAEEMERNKDNPARYAEVSWAVSRRLRDATRTVEALSREIKEIHWAVRDLCDNLWRKGILLSGSGKNETLLEV